MPSKEEKKPIGFLGFEYAAMMHEEVRAIVELLSPFLRNIRYSPALFAEGRQVLYFGEI